MQLYQTPGVYFEWLDAPAAPAAVRTDVAAFVGIAARGPLHRPVRVESWTQFTSAFGGFLPQSYLAPAVDGFFANGGRVCWVVRVADPDQAQAASVVLQDGRAQNVLRLDAASRAVPPEAPGTTPGAEPVRLMDPGAWANELKVRVVGTGDGRFTLTLRLPDGTLEQWRDVTLDAGDPRKRYVVDLLNDPAAGSGLVWATDLRPPDGRKGIVPSLPPLKDGLLGGAGQAPPPSGVILTPPRRAEGLSGGADGLLTLEPKHLSGDTPEGAWGLATLESVPEVSLVAMPDIMPQPLVRTTYRAPPVPCGPHRSPPARPGPPLPGEFPPRFTTDEVAALQNALIRHCELLRDRMALLDPPPHDPALGPDPLQDPDEIITWRKKFASKYAALYYPWLLVPDALGEPGDLRAVPPSGHVAGVFARVDLTVGVHKPPANEPVERVEDLTVAVDDPAHGILNDSGVNVLRALPARGIRVAGARTLSDPGDDPSWRFVNVRRLVLMVERWIDANSQWIPFEPNNPALWVEMDRVVRRFLDGLWRQGMLDGARAEEAYYVRCDDTTNPDAETAAGRIICEIGLQPPWPAEFVVVRIGRTEGGTQILETSGVSHG
jgi:uncharacterized protein